MTRKKRKNTPKKLASDQDFLDAFQREQKEKTGSESEGPSKPLLNRHGVPVIQDIPTSFQGDEEDDKDEMDAEEFHSLLEASFKQPVKGKQQSKKPMPLKRRLKRYPPPEMEVDLHGFTALGAEIKARSFITTCHSQGYFTLRIIVGKGLHSDMGPVLPDVMEDLLSAMKKENLVLSFEWDRKKKVRSGSLIVYLKRFDDDPS